MSVAVVDSPVRSKLDSGPSTDPSTASNAPDSGRGHADANHGLARMPGRHGLAGRAGRHGAELFVVVGVHPLQLAIPCGVVREMLQIPRVNIIPGAPPFVRGVVNLRGEVLPMIDLRRRLGLPPYGAEDEEFTRMMEQRAEDHKRWLAELHASLQENRPFTLATDHTQCAFGQWYSEFRTDNVVLSSLLRSFEAPHREIHHIAVQTQLLVANGKSDEARNLAENAEHTVLARLLALFGRVGAVLRETQREMAVVIEIPGSRRVAVSVDEVRAVEPVNVAGQSGAEKHESESEDPLVGPAIRRENDQGLVSILRVEHLLECTAALGASNRDRSHSPEPVLA